MEAETVTAVSEPLAETAGQLYRQKHGYSRTMGELLRKHGKKDDTGHLTKLSLAEYKALRRKRKRAVRATQKDNHTTAKAKRGVAVPKTTKRR
jgi:hypothetical protein